MSQTEEKSKWPLTIWSRDEIELIPNRFRRILITVMPSIYILMALFGVTSFFFPIQTFVTVVGLNYSYIWASLIGVFSIVSLFGLIFRLRLELYGSLILALLLFIYPIYVLILVIYDPVHGGIDRLNSFFAVAIYPVMPTWRFIDISVDIRRGIRRKLYRESTQGEE